MKKRTFRGARARASGGGDRAAAAARGELLRATALLLCAWGASAVVQVPFQPPPRVVTVMGSMNASYPIDQPGLGTRTRFTAISDMEFCMLDRSLYWVLPWTSSGTGQGLWRLQTAPPYAASRVADLSGAPGWPWSMTLDASCTAYVGMVDHGGIGGILRVTRAGAWSTLAVIPATDPDTIVLDAARNNLWVACGSSSNRTNPGMYKVSVATGAYTLVLTGDYGDRRLPGALPPGFAMMPPTSAQTGLAVDAARDRLWMVRWNFGVAYLDLGTEALSGTFCAGGYDYTDGPCATAKLRDAAFARYVPGADALLFTDYSVNGLRAVLFKTMEVVTVAGCAAAAWVDADGVGTSACFYEFVQSVALDPLSGDLYVGVYLSDWVYGAVKRVGTGAAMWPLPHLRLEGGAGLQLAGGAAFALQ
eukprot:tig00021167_g19057.t1